jgi:APA family basic amino acid/polyamine antiporter
MAKDGLFFRSVAAVHPRFRTPHVAVLLISTLAIAYLPIRNFEQLMATLILGMWPFLAMAVMGVMILRKRVPSLDRPYRTPLYPLPPILFLLGAAGIFATSMLTDPRATLINFAVLILGIPAYFIWVRLYRS